MISKIYANGKDEIEFLENLKKRSGETNKKVEQVEADFIAGIFVFQIGAVCHIILSDVLQVTNYLFPVDTKQRAYDGSITGADS